MKRWKVAAWLSSALVVIGSPAIAAHVSFSQTLDQRLLAAHNLERATLGLPVLRWNAELAAGAKLWADHLAQTGRFEHSPNTPGASPLGENIWGGTSGAYQPESMVGLWIAEKRHFRAGVFPQNSDTGRVQDVAHYTQVVWRDTGEVGCALSKGSQEDILVCRYSDPGNVIGRNPL
jgi:hypothetical protein